MTNKDGTTSIHIVCQKLSKKFIQDTVIKEASFEAYPDEIIAITGPNGSGKSTLLQLISGHTSAASGSICWYTEGEVIEPQLWFNHLSMAAPYIDLIDEYTVAEMIAFHFGFKQLLSSIKLNEVAEMALLAEHTHKRVKTLSSGMKQRLKLTLALLCSTGVVLIDEPTTNLDMQGKAWFAQLLKRHSARRIIFIATNDSFDINLTHRSIDVLSFK